MTGEMTAGFDDVRFPLEISRGTTGGPERRTDVVLTASGGEERNSRWADSRRRYEAGFGVKSLDDIHRVIAFFEERRGRLMGFRFRDPADFKSCAPLAAPGPSDQHIGTGDGSTRQFALVKRYGAGSSAYVRRITKPVAGSVMVAVGGAAAAQAQTDALTGIVSFPEGQAPPPGAAVTAGFLFDVPVRFDTDALRINLTQFAAGDIPAIPLTEIRA